MYAAQKPNIPVISRNCDQDTESTIWYICAFIGRKSCLNVS